MQKRKYTRGAKITPLVLLTLFILTIKRYEIRYEISDISFLVLNIPSLFSSSKNKSINLHNLLRPIKKIRVFSILRGYDIFSNRYTLCEAGGILWVEL